MCGEILFSFLRLLVYKICINISKTRFFKEKVVKTRGFYRNFRQKIVNFM